MSYKVKNNIGEVELISLFHKGNEKAMALLFEKYHHGLLYLARQYIADRATAEDIVVESFTKIWQRSSDFDNLPSIRSFLYITVRNACVNQLKRWNRYESCHEEIKYLAETSEELFAERHLIKAELLNTIWEGVEQLPPVRRRIFKLLFADGLNSFEVARELCISVDTVRVQKSRALQSLRAFVRQRL